MPAQLIPIAGDLTLGVGSVLLAAQSAFSAATSLYAWEDESRYTGSRAPETFEAPAKTFTILLPARHEEAVIAATIQKMVDLNYPGTLVEVLVVMEEGDAGTIATVEAKLEELASQGVDRVRLLTFAGLPINKPRGLNIGLAEAKG
ncbi:MAG: glycosyltransferase, partial [Actinomycetota bacterium]